MSLPPGFLDELRDRTSLSQVVGRKVMWDARKSNQGKGDMWAPCPFHQEKSASFHVDDRKGFYYCFGCHAKGDAITFVRETENVGFMEAVEILARENGMTMPARDPKAQEKSDYRTELAKVMEMAVQYFRLQLKTGAAEDARAYLTRRGFNETSLERWEIGYAPDQRQGLFSHLTGKGVAPDLIVDAGLCAKPDDGGAPYDRFRGRIIFPIRDARNRAIALGGRSLDPNARAKYLNSPETQLFDKGRSLFNQGPARAAAGKDAPLIVAEGYMDVIALSEYGFTGAVAPLGTAITQDQLRMLWRISPEPVIALDGDKAGLRAAQRLIDLALPMLEAGQSLRFVILPEGQDPDDLLKSKGAGAMQDLLDGAQPMVNLLWQRETAGKNFDSPERKAALDKTLREAIKKIRDPSIRGHYGDAIKELRWDLFGTRRDNEPRDGFQSNFSKGFSKGKGNARRKWADGPSYMPTTKASALVASDDAVTDRLREAVILAVLVKNPEIIEKFELHLERLDLSTDDHRYLRDQLLHMPPGQNSADFMAALDPMVLENLLAPRHVQLVPAVHAPGDLEIAEMCVADELAKLATKRGAAREISDAIVDMDGMVDEGITWRLGQAAEARNKAARSETEDKASYDTADNGASLNREERDAFENLLGKISFNKQKRHT